MIVVSDTSPIINLASVGRLELLRELYGRVFIPQAVYDEVSLRGAGLPGATEVQVSGWIETRRAANPSMVLALQLELGEGEAEAIALAAELNAGLLLLDERKGRMVAARFRLKVVGLLGVLVEAKHRGLVAAIKPIMDEMIVNAGFHMSQELHARVLESVGE